MTVTDANMLDQQTLELFAASVERYGQDKYGFDQYRALLRTAPGFSRQAWSDYAAMGWLAAARPLEDGGFDSHPVALAALMRYAGQHLALEPLVANLVLCAPLLSLCGADPAARERLEALSAGRRLFALAHAEDLAAAARGDVAAVCRDAVLHGRKVVVLHGDVADELIVSARDGAGLSLFAVPVAQPAVRKTSYRLLDGRGAASFELAGASAVPIGARGQAGPLLDEVLDGARLALCSEVHGAILALNRQTLAYLKERRQFGRPIGANQALQHRMVELFMLEQEVAAVIGAAQRATAAVAAQRQRAIMGAAAHTMGAGRHIAHEAVQLHGGIGATDELAIGHYFKRIMVVNRLLGDRDAQMDAFARADALCSAQPGASA